MSKLPARHGMTWTDEDYFTLLDMLGTKGTTLSELCAVLERTEASVLPKMSRFGFGVDEDGNVVSTGPITLAAQGTYAAVLERWHKKKPKKTFFAEGGDEVSGPMSAEFPKMGSLRDMDFRNTEQRVVASLFNKAKLQQLFDMPRFKTRVLRFPVTDFTAQELQLAGNYRDQFIKDHLGEPYAMTLHKSRGIDLSDLSDALNNGLLHSPQLQLPEQLQRHARISNTSQPSRRYDMRQPPGEALLDGFFFNATDDTSKEPSMNFDINFNFKVTTTTTYTLNARSVLCKSDGELLDDIAKIEATIKQLQTVETVSAKTQEHISKLRKTAQQLAYVLDNRDELSKTSTVYRDTVLNDTQINGTAADAAKIASLEQHVKVLQAAREQEAQQVLSLQVALQQIERAYSELQASLPKAG